MRFYEDLEVGSRSRSPVDYVVTEEEILEMGRRWDPQPFHTDPEAAAASPFGGLVASTVHLFAISVRIGMEGMPIAAVSSLGLQHMTNHAPARPGDVLQIEDQIAAKRLSNSKPGIGIVTFENTLANQRDEPVFSFQSNALVRCREA